MIIAKVVVGTTRISLEQGMVDGLYVVVRGRETMFVSDNEESAREYFHKLITPAA